jgi:hypothetical protein
MLTAGQAAVLIAAVSFAVLAGAGVYALVKLARLISATTRAVDDLRVRGDLLVSRANAAVDRVNSAAGEAHEQLARTAAVTANMDRASSAVAELTADISLLTSAVRTLLGGPLGRLAALTYGVRHAIVLRRRPHRPVSRPASQLPGASRPPALVAAIRRRDGRSGGTDQAPRASRRASRGSDQAGQ